MKALQFLPKVFVLFLLVWMSTGGMFKASASGTIQTIAIEGEPAPDGNGDFGNQFSGPGFGQPAINAGGEIAFMAFHTNTAAGLSDRVGLYRFNGVTLETLARSGLPASPTMGSFSGFKIYSTSGRRFLTLNDPGTVGVFATVSGDPDYASVCGAGIFQFANGTHVPAVLCGGADPRGLGTFNDIGEHGLNRHGRVAFQARVNITDFDIRVGVFHGTENDLFTVLMQGDSVPDSAETFTASLLRGFNDEDQLLIFADDTGDEGGLANEAIYLGGRDGLQLIVKNDTAPPEGDGLFRDFALGAVNNSNVVAFVARLKDTAGGTSDDAGLYLGTTNALYRVAREGDLSPLDRNWGTFRQPALNDRGEMAILVTGNSAGIYVFTTNLVAARVPHGTPPPDGQGTLNLSQGNFPNVAINNRGQVLFQATISGGPSDQRMGVFLADPDGSLHQVVRRGQPLLGSTVSQVEMTSVGGVVDAGGEDLGSQRALNDAGQVAFWAELADGRDGIFLWSPPVAAPTIGGFTLEGADVVVRVSSEAGRSYQLLRSETLDTSDWEGEGDSVEGTGEELELRHPDAGNTFNQQFYQVEVTSP